jgi:hypothetical protein
MPKNQLDKLETIDQTLRATLKPQKKDEIINSNSKKNKTETIHPKPQAQQVMNLGLNSENDI